MKGHIRKRIGAKGVTWQLLIDLPADPQTGKRRQKCISRKTKREAEAEAARMNVAVEGGSYTEADNSKLTVEQYLTKWLDSIGQTVKPITQKRYRDLLRIHALPFIGRIQLTKLSPLDLQRLYNDRVTAGKSTTYVGTLHVVLHRALKQAMRWGILTRNVTEAVDPPRKASPICNPWTQKQVAAFLAASDGDENAALWRLALSTGMRRGELLALRWEDVDLPRKVIAVKYTYSRSAAGGFEMGQPKTPQSRRAIALSPSVVSALQAHRIAQVEHRLSVGSLYTDLGMVFASPEGKPINPSTLARHFTILTARAGVPKIRFHDIRHTSATLMLANNVHPKIVQERLGHSDVSMTLNRYSHVTMDMQRDVADQMDGFMEGVS